MLNLEMLIELLVKGVVLLIAMPVHECAHAWAAHKLGDNTAKNIGRLTLNPVKHLSLMGSLSMLLIGVGWAKPVPINPNNFKNRKVGMALSSFAGPVSNILLAVVFMIAHKICAYILIATGNPDAHEAGLIIWHILYYGAYLNVALGLFNLLPIPPLDGSRLATVFLPEKTYFGIMRYEQIIFIILIVLMLTGVLDPVLSTLMNYTMLGIDKLTFFVDLIGEAVTA